KDMYVALANADASANAYFTLPAGAAERSPYLDSYDAAFTQAELALARAVAYSGADSNRLAAVQLVATRLQNYRAVIDEATRVAGGGTQAATVVATAYARDASDYLRNDLLSAVGRLWTNET